MQEELEIGKYYIELFNNTFTYQSVVLLKDYCVIQRLNSRSYVINSYFWNSDYFKFSRSINYLCRKYY